MAALRWWIFACTQSVPLSLKRQDWNQAIVEANKYLEIVGLKGRADLPPVKLSGGEQQRLAIARTAIPASQLLDL